MIKYIPRSPEEAPTTGKQAYADAPVSMEEVQQMVARSVEGLTIQNVFVTYSGPRVYSTVYSPGGSFSVSPSAR